MKKVAGILLFLFLLGIHILPAFGAGDTTIAKVGPLFIWASEVQIRVAQSNKISQEEAFKSIVEEKLLLARAIRDKIEPSSEDENFYLARIEQQLGSKEHFNAYLKENNLTRKGLIQSLYDAIRVNLLIDRQVRAKIKISPTEISQRMEELSKEGKKKFLRRKQFASKEEADEFLRSSPNPIAAMDLLGWIPTKNLDPDILSMIDSIKEKEFSKPLKIGEGFSIFFIEQSIDPEKPEEFFFLARRQIQEEKFQSEYAIFLAELWKTIPIHVFKK
ncbi:MAG: hypothetical protein WDA18_02470 [Candidatus Ratteibacteria bacterium]|jgi:parvulin-like peptidyl-prolyl isomerase